MTGSRARSTARTGESTGAVRTEVTYHADPWCGWCFTIADELANARAELGSDVDWTLRMGGLVVGDRVRPVARDADDLRSGLDHVARVSGRRSSPAYFNDVVEVGKLVSDSESVCRAVLTATELGGTDAGFRASHLLFDRLHVDGREPDDGAAMEALA